MTWAELYARLDAATGPDRALDATICATARYPRKGAERWEREWSGRWDCLGSRVHLLNMDGDCCGYWRAQPITASVDAALALMDFVLPGWVVLMGNGAVDLKYGYLQQYVGGQWKIILAPAEQITVKYSDVFGWPEVMAPTLPLAILKALVQVKMQEDRG